MGATGSQRGWTGKLAAGAGVAYAVLRLAPWSPAPVGVDLDESWRWVFHEAWRRGWRWGSEIVFTGGPYGFLTTETFHPATYPLLLGIEAAQLALLALALHAILVRRGAAAIASLFALPAIAECIGLWDVAQTLPLHLGVALVALHFGVDVPRRDAAAADATGATRGERGLLHLLAAALALAALVKFTYSAFAALALGAVALDEAVRRRRFPWLVVTAAASWLALWRLAGQPLAGIAPFLVHSLDIVAGFDPAMALDGPGREIALYLAAAGLLAALWRAECGPSEGPHAWLPFATLVALLWLAFKICFVRHDAHALTAVPLLLPWCIVGLLAAAGRGGTRPARVVAPCALAAALAYAALVLPPYRGGGLPELLLRELAAWPARAASAADALAGADALRERHRAVVERIRREIALPPLRGGVDLYPSFPGLLLAHGLGYRPRPVIQSYSAYTPRLARRNAAHLASRGAPDAVLFQVQPVDGRFPSLDDGLSWPALLTRYDVAGRVAGFALLTRTAKPRAERLRRLGSWRVRTGERFALPRETRGRAVWATLDLRPTAWGRLRSLAYRAPIVVLEVGLRDGHRERHRLIPGLARAGFLLSPRIASTDDWLRLLTPSGRRELDAAELVDLRVTGRRGVPLGAAFDSALELTLWEFDTGSPASRPAQPR